jgi:hypothetical protein
MPLLKINKINPFAKFRKDELLGIDMNDNTLKLVYARTASNKLQIQKVLTRPIAGLSDDETAKAIRSLYSEVKGNPYVINVLPPHVAITKNIEIPSTNPHEIKEIINLQAGRHTPYAREEIVVDYIDIGTYRRSYTKILLIIVARSALKRQFFLLERAGIRLDKVLLGPEGLARASARLLKLDTAVLPASVLHIDESFTDFTVIFKEKPIFIRSIPIGAALLTQEREKYQSRFIEEIKKTLEAYQNEDIERTPQAMCVAGAVFDAPYLESVLSEALRLPVKAVPYLNNLAVSPEIADAVAAAPALSFLGVIATLFSRKDARVDLIPDEIKLRRAIEQRGRDLIKTGVFILAIFLLIFFILLSKIHFKDAYLSRIKSQLEAIDPSARELEGSLSKVNLIKSYLLKRGFSLEVLTELYNLVPLEIELSDIRFDEQAKFTIRGTAESMSAVFGFVDGMEKSKYFRDVKTKYTTKRKEGLKDVTDFEITCVLEKESK